MIPTLPFGRTGHLSTRTIFGAAALADVTQQEADATLELLLEHGVNHIDTAASYGRSEERIGPWMQRHRRDFFLATKVEERTYDRAWQSIRRSLERLRVEQVDLLQLHNVSDAETWEQVMGPNGALQAVLEARDRGLTRFIGITGHGTQIARLHLRALERMDFDAVLLPYNYPMMQNPQYAADFRALLQVCEARNVAVQTIKSLCRRPWGRKPQTRATWYEPLEEQADIDKAVHWVLATQPRVFLNTVGDIHILPRVLDAARRFDPGQPVPDMSALARRLGMEPLFV
ncbi:MAG: aldo/keto reductase [Caldilineae bacterium]|nr:MAG: aldo/keto reductase [Caldilineae bacterium]